MVRDGQIGLEDAKRILRMYWWIPPITVTGCVAIAMLLASVLPKKYTSQTLILVQQPAVPTDIVRPVVTEDLNHRLASMQEQILSRTRLEPIIEKLGLYPEVFGKVHIEDLVERLRTSIVITPLSSMPGTQNQSLPGFYVNVTFDNPQLGQQICTEITSMFMEQNARALEQQAARTTSFLSEQLAEAKAKLDAQDGKLAQFKMKYLGSLPEEEQRNLSLLMGMNSQLEANTQTLNRAQQDKVFDESMFNQEKASLEKRKRPNAKKRASADAAAPHKTPSRRIEYRRTSQATDANPGSDRCITGTRTGKPSRRAAAQRDDAELPERARIL